MLFFLLFFHINSFLSYLVKLATYWERVLPQVHLFTVFMINLGVEVLLLSGMLPLYGRVAADDVFACFRLFPGDVQVVQQLSLAEALSVLPVALPLWDLRNGFVAFGGRHIMFLDQTAHTTHNAVRRCQRGCWINGTDALAGILGQRQGLDCRHWLKDQVAPMGSLK